jgi:hypothetical protein
MRRGSWILGLALVLAIGCKKYDEPNKIGEACKDDKECEEPLVCREGLRASAACVKPCGPRNIETQINADQTGKDYTCPQGWECTAVLERRYRNLETGEQGSSFGGWHDQPICVPAGWKPAPTGSAD